LKELNGREEMDFSGFIGNLKTHEMEVKVQEERGISNLSSNIVLRKI